MLSVIMLSVIMVIAIMLIVIPPSKPKKSSDLYNLNGLNTIYCVLVTY
jgi:hypothetical protein